MAVRLSCNNKSQETQSRPRRWIRRGRWIALAGKVAIQIVSIFESDSGLEEISEPR